MRLRPQACFEANRRKAALRPRWHIESAPAAFGYFPPEESNEGTVPPSRTTVRSLQYPTGASLTGCGTGCCGPDHACLLTDQKAPKVAGGPLRKGRKPPDPCLPKSPDLVAPLADTTIMVAKELIKAPVWVLFLFQIVSRETLACNPAFASI